MGGADLGDAPKPGTDGNSIINYTNNSKNNINITKNKFKNNNNSKNNSDNNNNNKYVSLGDVRSIVISFRISIGIFTIVMSVIIVIITC